MEHVAVTGLGIVSPIGSTTQSFWRHLLEGRRAIAPMDGDERLSGNAFWAAVGDDFLEASALPRGALRNTDRFTQYAMVATHEALAHAVHRSAERFNRSDPRQHDGRLSVRRRIADAFSRSAAQRYPETHGAGHSKHGERAHRDALGSARAAARDQHGLRVVARRDRACRRNDRARRDRGGYRRRKPRRC